MSNRSSASCPTKAVLSLIWLLSLTIDNKIFNLPVADAVWLAISAGGTKCLSEEIHNNVVVVADYYVVGTQEDPQILPVTATVTSPYGNNLHHKENVTYGQFAFTTHESGSYMACFTVDPHTEAKQPITLGIDWKIGIAAKDWDSVAKKEKIEGVELHLRRLAETVDSIHRHLNDLSIREAEMREVSEVTKARVAGYSIMSISICIVVSVLQSWRLKRYFLRKKLI